MSTKSRTRVAGKSLRKAGVGGAALTLAAATAFAGAGVANAIPGFSFNRIAGIDRYETSALTEAAFGPSTNAILASGEAGHSVDALSSALLAGVKQAPVVLTRNAFTPANVLAQLQASGVKNIFIVGGNGVVSDAQANALTRAGFNVTRIGGIDRYATSAMVIAAAGNPSAAAGNPGGNTALLASGTVFADALGAGALSYAKDIPVAITDPNTLPASTLTALQNAGIKNILVVGGVAAVSPTVRAQLAAAGFTVDNTTLAGLDRSSTSVQLANFETANFGFTKTAANVASGAPALDGADALGGAALSGKELRPLLITVNVNDPGVLPAYFAANAATRATGTIFGGVGAVSQAIQDVLTAAAQGTVTPPVTNQTLAVTPNTAATQNVNTIRQFTLSGLDNTKTFTIQLVNCANTTTSPTGQTSFTGTNTGGSGNTVSPGDTGNNSITVVNGVGNTAGSPTATATPSNGTLSFTVQNNGTASCVVPVVFQDANGNKALDLNANGTPSEPFGQGGTTNFINPGAAGTINASTVTSATPTTFTNNSGTFTFSPTDVFQLRTPNGPVTITFAEFQQRLSTGDSVSGFNGGTNQSTFVLDDTAPKAPANVTAMPNTGQPGTNTAAGVNQGGTTVSFTDSTNIAVTAYNIYRAPAIVSGVAGQAATCPTNPAPANGGSPQTPPTAPYTQIGTVNDTLPAGGTYFFNDTTQAPVAGAPVSTSQFCFLVSSVAPNAAGGSQVGSANGNGSTNGNTAVNTPAAAPANQPAATLAPAFTNAVTIVNAGAVTGVTVNYNEPINCATVDGTSQAIAAGGFAVPGVFDFRVSHGTGPGSTQFAQTITSVTCNAVANNGNGQVMITFTPSQAVVNAPNANATTFLVTAQTGTDGNTVGNTTTPVLFQAVDNAVQATA